MANQTNIDPLCYILGPMSYFLNLISYIMNPFGYFVCLISYIIGLKGHNLGLMRYILHPMWYILLPTPFTSGKECFLTTHDSSEISNPECFAHPTKSLLLHLRRLRHVINLHQRRSNDKIGRRYIAGNDDVPGHGQSNESFHVAVVRLRFQRVPKEDDQVHLALGNHGTQLLIATQRACDELFHFQIQLFFNDTARGAGGYQLMFG